MNSFSRDEWQMLANAVTLSLFNDLLGGFSQALNLLSKVNAQIDEIDVKEGNNV